MLRRHRPAGGVDSTGSGAAIRGGGANTLLPAGGSALARGDGVAAGGAAAVGRVSIGFATGGMVPFSSTSGLKESPRLRA